MFKRYAASFENPGNTLSLPPSCCDQVAVITRCHDYGPQLHWQLGGNQMLFAYDVTGAALTKRDGLVSIEPTTVWIDLLNPTPDEDKYVETALGIEIPTRAEAREIEASNRLYVENGAHYMTAFIMYNIEQSNPGTSNVTFILVGDRLVTVRYVEPKAFSFYVKRIERGAIACATGPAIMVGLLETFLHRKADLIERIQDDVDKMASSLFELNVTQRRKQGSDLGSFMQGTGRGADIIARCQESAVSIERVLLFFASAMREHGNNSLVLERIAGAQRDNSSLMEHMKFIQGRTNFLLDATLGLINTEQNQIIKLFSVMAVMLMPPTLVASIYGMNFKAMPELNWEYGYPMAICIMLLSGLIPYVYFRRKGWL